MDGSEEKLHLGYQYGFIGNPKGFLRDAAAEYRDLGGEKDIHTPYLHGTWIVRAQEIEYAGTPEEGYIAVRLNGERCQLVGEGEKFRVEQKENITHFVPHEKGVRVQEIIFSDPRA